MICEVKTRILIKIGLKNVQLSEMAEPKALSSRTDQIQLEMIPIGETIAILLPYGNFDVNGKEKTTTL